MQAPPGTPSRWNRGLVFALALLCLAAVMLSEWYLALDYSLGTFYVFPVLVAGMALSRPQVVLFAAFCAWARSHFVPDLPPIEYWLRFMMAMLAYSGAGLLVAEISRNRRIQAAAFQQLKLEQQMRRDAENQLRMLADSSPAAILTLNSRSEVLAANRAGHELLGFDQPGSLVGKCIADHVPVFAGALRASQGNRAMRTSATSWAKRADGIVFPVTTWFSTYREGSETYLAGILVDTSEDVRERERENFRHLYHNNRLLASAVSHEIRNLCLALRVVSSNLRRQPGLDGTPDFVALTKLIENLTRVSSFELSRKLDQNAANTDLRAVLDQLRVVIEPDWQEVGGTIHWDLDGPMPPVHADAHLLLQVLLNLSHNSLRAVQDVEKRTLFIRVRPAGRDVVVEFVDSGPGISDASTLFQPFRNGSSGTGLGLYISRNLVRSCGGELTFVPTPIGCRFEITLALLEPVQWKDA
jgi:two-component system, LuxR family, sensor kinase FixL